MLVVVANVERKLVEHAVVGVCLGGVVKRGVLGEKVTRARVDVEEKEAGPKVQECVEVVGVYVVEEGIGGAKVGDEPGLRPHELGPDDDGANGATAGAEPAGAPAAAALQLRKEA